MLGFAPLAAAPLASSGVDVNLRQLILAATEAQDAVSINLDGTEFVALEASEAPDVAAFDTVLFTFVYIDTSEAPDVASFDAYSHELLLAASESPDLANIAIEVSGVLYMSAIESPDGISAPVIVLWTPADDPTTDIWVRVDDNMPYNQTVI